MQTLVKGTDFTFLNLSFTKLYSFIFIVLFVSGNLILPQLIHSVPKGGLIFLPIYFFTLIAAYKFGFKVGITTALLSPLVNNLIFGMPPTAVLPFIIIKSTLLAFFASIVSYKLNKIKIHYIALVVFLYQIAGSIIEGFITNSFLKAIQDVTVGWPGILIQIFLGFGILTLMAKYDPEKLG
ncbi:MAG: hypothetical protein ACOVJ8_01635 [Sediminibacterium sp.]|jgi:hypothetical protein